MAKRIPPGPPAAPTMKDDDIKRNEDAFRYRIGSRSDYEPPRVEWTGGKGGRTWNKVKAAVRRGWDRVTK